MEKKHLQKQDPSMGIFIFYQEPDPVYWNAVQSFFGFGLGLTKNQILKYSIMDYEPNSGYFDMMTLILDEIHSKGVYAFHNMFIYVDNSHLLETDYHKNELWYRLFDNYAVHHLLFIYKDVVAYENELFAFKLVCKETNLQIEQNPINSFMRNRVIVLDDMNLEEFCLLILNSAQSRRTGLLDFLPQWLEISNADTVIMRANFIPTNDTWAFHNYKKDTPVEIHSNCVVSTFIGQMTGQFLETLYRQLKFCQKKKILKAIKKC